MQQGPAVPQGRRSWEQYHDRWGRDLTSQGLSHTTPAGEWDGSVMVARFSQESRLPDWTAVDEASLSPSQKSDSVSQGQD